MIANFDRPRARIEQKPAARRRLGVLFSIVAVGFVVRVWVAIFWQNSILGDEVFRFGDSDTYWVMAKKIAQGQPYQYGSPDSKLFRAPLYPMFLAPWTWWENLSQGTSRSAVLGARIGGCVLGGLCIALIMGIAKTVWPNHENRGIHPRVWAGALAALYPGAIGMSVFILSEALFCPLMLFSMGCVSLAIRSKRNDRWEIGWTWMLISGAISGAACLTRPSWSLWPAILFCYLFLLAVYLGNDEGRKIAIRGRWLMSCLLFCVGICLVMGPWWVRNYLVTGKFVPTTLQVGASLVDGWHPGASGSSDEGMAFVNAFIVEQKIEDENNLLAGNPLESTLEWRLDRRMKNAAISWAYENSSDAMWLGLVKLSKTWSPLPIAKELGSDAVRWFEAIGYTAIMCLALIGIWQCRFEVGAWLYAMPCVYFALLHMFFIGSVRYRQPAVLAICVLSGIGFASVAKWIFGRKPVVETKRDGTIATSDVTVDESKS